MAPMRTSGGLKGHESIAQALAWVYIFNGSALKGRQKNVLLDATEWPARFGDPFP